MPLCCVERRVHAGGSVLAVLPAAAASARHLALFVLLVFTHAVMGSEAEIPLRACGFTQSVMVRGQHERLNASQLE